MNLKIGKILIKAVREIKKKYKKKSIKLLKRTPKYFNLVS